MTPPPDPDEGAPRRAPRRPEPMGPDADGGAHGRATAAPWRDRLQRTLRRASTGAIAQASVPVGWWRGLSPARQDRVAALGPLVSVLLFLAAISAAFWYLRAEEIDRTREAVSRDAEIAQQQIRLALLDNQEQFARMARELATPGAIPERFVLPAGMAEVPRPPVRRLVWLDSARRVRAELSTAEAQWPAPAPDPAASVPVDGSVPAVAPAAPGDPTLPVAGQRSEAELTFQASKETRRAAYSRPYADASGAQVFQLQLPLIDRGHWVGTLLVEYGIDALLRHEVPADITHRHGVAIIAADQSVQASTVWPPPQVLPPGLSAHLPVDPVANGLMLRVWGHRSSVGLIGNTLFWMVVALSVLTLWMLLISWRHNRHRTRIQAVLTSEMNFRRAMENSMLTGMRAMDADGRVSYVNPAFCAMTGYSEAEHVGSAPPYPYWPPDRRDENMRLLMLQLQGRSPVGGSEVRVRRKDGSEFDARIYVSPLIDPQGQQSGWMASMTNITEAKRARDQLAASHERFTTVLEGLEAVVSVRSLRGGELLFANRSYRLWFGPETSGHVLLASTPGDTVFRSSSGTDRAAPWTSGTQTPSPPREVFVQSLNMWFDVRTRELTWTDGSAAQMLVATNVSARRRAEDLARHQAEQAEVSARLITIGEMASSVAHELNQPLAAIANYCSGIISRVQRGNIEQPDLVAALEKTARQAERAGSIVHRIRSFVKRREPQRQLTHAGAIVDEALEIASIDLRRRKVQVHSHVAQNLPPLWADPILIEQVLLNLLRNAADAIDEAGLLPSRRHVELRVAPRHLPDVGGMVEFSVRDHGPGIAAAMHERLFESFHSTKRDGLGIGLPLCRSIVESHQGRMKADNLYNHGCLVGARFSFTLPLATAAQLAAPNPEHP